MASGVLNSWACSRSVHRLWIFLWQTRWTQSVLRPPSLLGTKWWRLMLGPGSIGRPQIGQGPSVAASATALGALQDAFRQRLVVAVEVVAAAGLDPPGAVERGVEADGLVLVVLAVEALHLGVVEAGELGRGRQGVGGGAAREPAGEVDDEVGPGRGGEEGDLADRVTCLGRQAVDGGRQDVGAERVADEDDARPAPGLSVAVDDGGEVARELVGGALGPEVAERVDADGRHAAVLQHAGELLVDVAPAAVAGDDHRHQGAGLLDRDLDHRQVAERRGGRLLGPPRRRPPRHHVGGGGGAGGGGAAVGWARSGGWSSATRWSAREAPGEGVTSDSGGRPDSVTNARALASWPGAGAMRTKPGQSRRGP